MGKILQRVNDMKTKRVSLKVRVPERFMEQLSKRFSYESASVVSYGSDVFKKIDIPCPLCQEYQAFGCKKCPFYKFKKLKDDEKIIFGCNRWLKKVLNLKSIGDLPFRFFPGSGISWSMEKDEEVKKCLNLLREKAKELIKWI